ncbi:MaoC/PaaZ C-terminal domain-containing protein [Kocuria sp. HSID16901]|uniref:MaoC/PaaZ C-terminal domain-containing protein n=1 Tax=Kocuria sp. HSID16901 TaxID=2419505 RepID=UPI000F87E69E|nr:MaoC/PaaZ C-terminal domain-containing protein [Kocuria sp. HSID16901]RUQ22586.1 acyl dehydratase [Kocuria sp. HSID16901]
MKFPSIKSLKPKSGASVQGDSAGAAKFYGQILVKELGAAVDKQLHRRGSSDSPARNAMPAPEALEVAERRVKVDAEKHAAFCAVVHAPAGEDAHGGFLHAISFPISTEVMTSRTFPLRLLGLIHLKNEVTQRRPIAVDSTVKIRSRVKEFGTHRRGVTVTILSEIWDDKGELAFSDESLYLSKQAKTTQEDETAVRKDSQAESTRREDPREGFRLIGRWRLPSETGRKYAKVSGDANPIHLSAASAKVFGFPSAIAHGMYCASRALGQLADDPAGPGQWTVEFGSPVVLPSTVEIWKDRAAPEGRRRIRGIGRKARKNFEFAWNRPE